MEEKQLQVFDSVHEMCITLKNDIRFCNKKFNFTVQTYVSALASNMLQTFPFAYLICGRQGRTDGHTHAALHCLLFYCIPQSTINWH
jgi:hypothetical protein